MGNQTGGQKDGASSAALSAIRSLLDEFKPLEDKKWYVSLLSSKEKSNQHSLLIMEGILQKDSDRDHVVYRFDCFRQNDANSSQGLLDTCLFRVRGLPYEELKQLHQKYDYVQWEIDDIKMERLIRRIKQDYDMGNAPYFLFGDNSVYSSSISKSGYNNCASWCESVLREVGIRDFRERNWALVKVPQRLLAEAKKKNQLSIKTLSK